MTTNELPREPNELDRLVSAAREGDRPAFDELVRRTYVDTYTLALAPHGPRGGRTRRGAGDISPCLEGPDALPRRRAVHHVDVPHHREHRLHRRSSAGGATAPSRSTRCSRTRSSSAPTPSPRTRPSRQALLARLVGAVSSELPPKLRVLVVLKDVYGLSHEEIAEELGISVPAAKVRLHRGRKQLRDLLYDDDSKNDGRWANAV